MKPPWDTRLDGWYVYRLYAADGALLYVGCTSDLAQRKAGHRSSKPWWPQVASWRLVGPFKNPDVAVRYESAAIYDERPRYGISKTQAGQLGARFKALGFRRPFCLGARCGQPACRDCFPVDSRAAFDYWMRADLASLQLQPRYRRLAAS